MHVDLSYENFWIRLRFGTPRDMKPIDMKTVANRTRRKDIEIREDVFHFLSIKAAASGTNLKNYIETLLEKDVEDMDETATYQYLCSTRPDGAVALSEKESDDFENWLGI